MMTVLADEPYWRGVHYLPGEGKAAMKWVYARIRDDSVTAQRRGVTLISVISQAMRADGSYELWFEPEGLFSA